MPTSAWQLPSFELGNPPKLQPQLSTPEVRDAVTSQVRQFANYFTDLSPPQPDVLFDRDDPAPMYLAEEMSDWVVGWDKIDWYFNTPARSKIIQAMVYLNDLYEMAASPEFRKRCTLTLWTCRR